MRVKEIGLQIGLIIMKYHTGAVTSEEDNLLPMRKKSPIEPSDMEQIGPISSSSYDAQQWSLVPYQNDVSERFMKMQSAYQTSLTYFGLHSRNLSLLTMARKPTTTILTII